MEIVSRQTSGDTFVNEVSRSLGASLLLISGLIKPGNPITDGKREREMDGTGEKGHKRKMKATSHEYMGI